MSRAHLVMASAITTLMLAAGGVVAERSFAVPTAPAFIAGGRATSASTEPRRGPARPPGALSAPLSSPKSLDADLAAAGHRVPAGANVYAAKVTKDGSALAYDDYQAGGGALAANFWPASSIKVLAAVGALEFVGKQGFTGAATVTFGDGAPRTLQSIYDGAIRLSSNPDYDRLVEIPGVDWLNREFLTAARGFPLTVIQRSYTLGGNLRGTPAITLSEGGRTTTMPARTGRIEANCRQGNCSNLFEMSESVRRIVLHDEIPQSERFHIARPDIVGLTAALLGADGWFNPAVSRVLGTGARIYSKPGFVPGRDCLDVTLIAGRRGQRVLLSATVPERQGGCPALVSLATNVLDVLDA